ncbi:hypothetical protein NDU88_003011 [Pleurodeles waltl]|uniref:ribonuclease H n=1 Tax=Pleurodeles waltl TaxID=8319 RepID=A0AAV7MCP4_PLEWA|nr:hypothetical protein NDU88_003011 [Pleurodeles waltl]
MAAFSPDRVYDLKIQIEGDVERTISVIFWDELTSDILLAERDWPSEHVRKLPHGEHVILPSFSDLVPEAGKEAYASEWALAQAPALYRNHVEKILTAVQMAVIKERPLAQGKRIIVVSPVPALEAVTKASVPNAKALHPRWIQWATSLTATDVDYIFDPKLPTQEFLQYEQEYLAHLNILPLDSYHTVIYTDGSAQPAVGTKHQYSAACAAVSGVIEDGVFHPHNTYTQTLGDCTAQLAELKALILALEHTETGSQTLIVCDSYYCVQSYNEYLNHWKLNGFRDSKVNTIKHKTLWGRVADLKVKLPCVHVVHTLGHQCVRVHVTGNTLADEAAKASVATASVAAVTRSRMRLDNEILIAVKASAAGKPLRKDTLQTVLTISVHRMLLTQRFLGLEIE